MKKSLLLLSLLFAISVMAVVKPGENLLLNGELEADQVDFPPCWAIDDSAGVSYKVNGGPKNDGCFILESKDSRSRACLRQQGFVLAPGETYKISAMIRTTNFKCAHNGIRIHNFGWTKDAGVMNMPENTNGWQKVEKTFVLFPSTNDYYGFGIFAMKYTGKLELAEIKFEAISPMALEKSQRNESAYKAMNALIIPWQPLLAKIPVDNPVMRFKLSYTNKNHDAVVDISEDGGKVQTFKYKQYIDYRLPNATLGAHTLKAVLRDSEGVQTERTFNATVITPVKVDTTGYVRLNNFVTIIKNVAVKSANEKIDFCAPKDGWIFVSCAPKGNAEKLKVTLDGTLDVIDASTPRLETFRLVNAGRHTLAVEGASGAQVVVKAIAEIFNYPLCSSSAVKQNGSYGWEFHKKYVFPAVTTVNGGFCPDEHLAELRKSGRIWLANLGTSYPKSTQVLLDKFKDAAGFTQDKYDGLTCDEQFFNSTELAFYAEAMWAYQNPKDKLIYTWIVGKPGNPSHSDFMSASINASRGRGKLIFEAYCHSKDTEENAYDYLETRLKDTITGFNNYFPNADASSGILLGNFNQIPLISLDVEPSVDYKYYLDMQLNMVANAPEFKNLGTVGYWGSYYDDEELYRWSFALLRHYAVEGKTEMLSKDPKYHYKYLPGHIQNCDFNNKLDKWSVSAAAEGSIQAKHVDGFGRRSQQRWGAGNDIGNNVCYFERKEGKANTISQSIVNLEPGRIYTLQFVSADYDDVVNGKIAPKKIGVSAKLGEGVQVIPEKSFVFIDTVGEDKKAARINLNHIRFKATAANTTVTFSDENAKPGEKTIFNYVMIKPYFEN